MRLIALAESSADEAAIRILTEAIRGPGVVSWVEPPPTLRSRGWPAVVRENLPLVIRHAYYRTDATGVIVVADTNASVLHTTAHNGHPYPDCRLCVLRSAAAAEIGQLPQRTGRPPLRVAIGVATPAVEGWYLCGKWPHPSEAAWVAGGARSYDKRALKQATYGTDRPNLVMETHLAIEEAQRLAGNLELLRTHFQSGYGALETDILAF